MTISRKIEKRTNKFGQLGPISRLTITFTLLLSDRGDKTIKLTLNRKLQELNLKWVLLKGKGGHVSCTDGRKRIKLPWNCPIKGAKRYRNEVRCESVPGMPHTKPVHNCLLSYLHKRHTNSQNRHPSIGQFINPS